MQGDSKRKNLKGSIQFSIVENTAFKICRAKWKCTFHGYSTAFAAKKKISDRQIWNWWNYKTNDKITVGFMTTVPHKYCSKEIFWEKNVDNAA